MVPSRRQYMLLTVPLLLLVRTCSGQQALAGGRFQTTTDVTSWLNLATDAADMREADTEQEKKDIYNNGRNAVFTADGGQETKRTLAGLSLNSYPRMAQDSLYNIFRHTFFLIGRDIENEPAGNFDQKPVQEYADTLVNDLFALNVKHIETEAAIILNVWMEIVHALEDVLRACKAKDADSMNASLDQAAALWIGADQPEGVNDAGNLMYNLAQIGGERFNQASGESASNVKVLDGMNDIQQKISDGTCSGDAGYAPMRAAINQVVGHMTIPLMQILIHHIRQQPADGGANFIELYALSFLPRVEACNPTAYKKLLTLLVRNTLKEDDKDEAIGTLQSIYNCLGFSCEDIGSYQSGEVPTCSDDEVQPEGLAGYVPTSDIHPFSFIDRDILAIRKMTSMGAYDAAWDWYKFGYNARISETEYITLHKLATSPFREVVTNQYPLYSSYFGTGDYADKMISNVLTSVAPFDLASPEQRSELVAGYMNEMVMYMASLEKLYEASKLCETNRASSQESLDKAVAFYVGSMEGPSSGGLEGGQLLYATSKGLCNDFSTCLEGKDSALNQKLIASFSAMLVSIQLGACPEVITTLQTEVEPLFPVTLIQGSLHYAVVNADIAQGAADASLGTADPFALSMIPFVSNVNGDLAQKLLANLQFRPDLKPVADTPGEVFSIFRDTIPQMAVDVNCDDVGQHATFGTVCSSGGPVPSADPGSNVQPTDDGGGPTPTAAPVAPPPGDDTLGFGRYVFTTDVSIAKLAFDVRDMRNAASADESTTAYSIVTNAPVSLQSLSTGAADFMSQDLAFNLFRFALASENEFGDGSYTEASTYADVAAQKALTVATDKNLAAEATVVLHVWMQIAHYLYESVRVCENEGVATDPLDQAVALWLGEGQQQGNDDTGFLMYSIAEKAATRFGHDLKSEAPINTQLISAFNQARAIAVDCAAAPEMFLDLRGVVADILKSMALPLMQNLFYYISRAGPNAPDYLEMENYVELYALSLVPHLIGCQPTSYFELQETLVDQDFSNDKLDQNTTEHLRKLQQCFDIDCSDLMADKIADSDLLQLVTRLCIEDTGDAPSIVGYQPATDVTEYLRFDRDIVQMGIMAETEAFDTAIDIYINGYNSRLDNRAVSLRTLATSPERANVPEVYQLFSSYYGTDKFADETIVNALRAQSQFSGASSAQRREAVIRMVQCSVSYMAILTELYTAVDKCKAGDGALSFWDKGVALFVGSIEGELSGGDINDYGEMLYSLAKETCDDFDTCEGSGNAAANEELMNAFNNGLGLLREKKCDSVASIIKNTVIPTLLIPMIQGTLDYSLDIDELTAGTDDDVLSTGFAISRAILPQVSDSNATSASVIDSDMNFQLDSDPLPDGSDAIFNAITYSVSGMGIDCKDIGTLDDTTSVCSDDLRPHQKTPTEMGGGMYTTTTYVKDRANIALDVLAIRNALQSGNVDLAKLLYKDGENSAIYNENGVQIGTRSLQSFSTAAPTEMADEPLFNIFRYALQDDQGQFLGQEVGLYADTLVSEAFDNTNPTSQTIAAEAVVVYNVWMYLVHELYQTLRQCKNKAIVDTDGIHSIDEAAAYWIGDGQVTGDAEQGHLLYALAEQMGEKFGLDESGQSRTNTNILRLFNQAKLEFSAPTACSDNPDTFPKLSQIVNRIVSWMTVPLIQGLISNLRENDKDRVKMYARAVLPLVAGCSESTYAFLSDKLFVEEYNVVEVEGIIARLQTTYECLGFTCADVGTHELDSTQACTDPPVLSPLAGYVPQSDVRSFSLLDLDILNANILMKMGAYGAVEDLYSHGKHALVEDENGLETLSLYQMATTQQRTLVPQFDSFQRYYESDKYADEIIRKALKTDDEKFGQASPEQRTEIVVKTMQYTVVYMAALQEMYQAIADCNSPDSGKILDAEEAWDRGAAFLIGSLEGTEDGGHEEGMSFYRLALKRCEQFGTCSPEGRPSWNDEFSSLLYTGRASVSGRACGELRKTVREIETLLLVPLIQGTLRYAISNEKLGENSPDKGIGEGFAFSRSVLPLVEDSNRDSATTIAENMEFQFNQVPVHQGARTVFSAFARAYGKMNVNCEDVGKAESFDACSGATSPEARDTNVGMIVGIVVGVIALFAIAALFVYDRKKKKKAGPKPTFLRPKGEMNHTSDRMSGDAYARGEAGDDEDEENPDIAVLVSPSPGKTEPLDDEDLSDNSFHID